MEDCNLETITKARSFPLSPPQSELCVLLSILVDLLGPSAFWMQ